MIATAELAASLPVGAGSRAEQLALAVETRIREDALMPGESVGTIEDLCAASGFSRPTVNEATRLLRDRGVVVIKPGRGGGVFVAPVSNVVRLRHTLLRVTDDAESVADAVELRDHLELLIVLGAARACTPADLAELRDLTAELAAADDWDDVLRTIWRLHARIAALCPNQLARAVYLTALERLSTTAGSRFDDQDPTSYRAARLRAHVALVDAIASGEERRIRTAVTRHNSTPDPAPPEEKK
jgi:GntR family transcriptional repressor for pyruvate dehydrogenase complex